MSFEEALSKIKADATLGMRLPSWPPEKVVFVKHDPTRRSLCENHPLGAAPWLPSCLDIFNDEWAVCANCQQEIGEEEQHDNYS